MAYTTIPYPSGDVQTEAMSDHQRERHLLVGTGWTRGQRVHECLGRADLIDGNFWIQRDGTGHGIAKELVAAGVPKGHIVLAFKPLEIRRHTGYALACCRQAAILSGLEFGRGRMMDYERAPTPLTIHLENRGQKKENDAVGSYSRAD